MMRGEHIPIEDLALFSLGNLASGEAGEIRLHLDECSQCRSEMAALSGDLALLGAAVESAPMPADARDRFLARIQAEVPTKAVHPVSIAREPSSKPLLWALCGAIAALIVLVVILLVRVNTLNQQLSQQSSTINRLTVSASRAQETFDVITAAGAQRVLLTPGKSAPSPTGRAIYLPSRGGLVFEAANLAPVPEGKAYELWVIPASGAAPIPAGVFWPDARGSASVVLPPLPKDVPAKAFGVTIERAEGSSTPTAPIILAGAV
ncbi:MAG TPA: anti-sigma factor [Terracidiphilus sp.]|nr:anti-sigma factor [Terracidiphilus sp.]